MAVLKSCRVNVLPDFHRSEIVANANFLCIFMQDPHTIVCDYGFNVCDICIVDYRHNSSQVQVVASLTMDSVRSLGIYRFHSMK